MRTIAIHQPAYIPWLGYFEKIQKSDIFVILDTVQFSKNSFDNRNLVSLNGKDKWLTVPVKTSKKFKKNSFQELEILQNNWQKSHWGIINESYGKSPFFDEFADDLEKFYKKKWVYFLDLAWQMLGFLLKKLEINTKIIMASSLDIKSSRSQMLLDICKSLKAKKYYSGIGAKDYLDESIFKKSNILVEYQKYQPSSKYSIIHNLFMYGAKLL